MDGYKQNEKAEMDLHRLYEYEVLSFGLDQADRLLSVGFLKWRKLPIYGNPLTISVAAIAAMQLKG